MTQPMPWDEWYLPTVGSTMDWARRLTTEEGSRREPVDALRVRTDQQLTGRGRRGAPWWDSPGGSILTTLAVRRGGRWDPHDRNPASMALRAGLAVSRTLEEFEVGGVRIKWPNDIYVDHRKVCGILIEADSQWFYIGIGLNLSSPEMPAGAFAGPDAVPAGDLAHLLPRQVGIHSVLHVLDHSLAVTLPAVEWVSAVEERLAWKGHGVCLQTETYPDVSGTLVGIDEDGAVLISDAREGRVARYVAGTLRLGIILDR